MKKTLILMITIFMFLCGHAVPVMAITLGWDANTDLIDGYNVYEREGNGFSFKDDVPCTENDPICCEHLIPNATLLFNTTYEWYVTAFKGPDGESGPSNIVTYTTGDPPVYHPRNPTGCFIKNISN